MKKSWLIQRLGLPHPYNPFNFGAGLKNGGLNEEASKHLSKIFSFDYMGAAEFEWGELPKTLSNIYKNSKDYGFYKILTPDPVWILCRRDLIEETGKFIKSLIEYGRNWEKEPLLEQTYLSSCIVQNRSKPGSADILGWLEFENGFFFFIDEDMARKTAELFEIHPEITYI